ncbi:MAG: hypothetical protein ABIB61_01540 [Candidatus Shapirobacteria bacterium]
MISKQKYKSICKMFGGQPELIYDGKNSSVFRFKKNRAIKCVKKRSFYNREVRGYNSLQPYLKTHLPKRYLVNDELLMIVYRTIDLQSFQQILLKDRDRNEKKILESYKTILKELFQIVLSSKKEKPPRNVSKYFYNTDWHIDKLIKSNYLFDFEDRKVEAGKLFTSTILVNGREYPDLISSLMAARSMYENSKPQFSFMIHGDENYTNLFANLSEPSEWYLIDPQWCINNSDWVILVLELYNGWRKYLLYAEKNSVSIKRNEQKKTVISYDLPKENWQILKKLDELLLAIADECSKTLGDSGWFKRFKSYYLFRSIRGGIWGHLGNSTVLGVSIGEGFRIFEAQNPNQVLKGL